MFTNTRAGCLVKTGSALLMRWSGAPHACRLTTMHPVNSAKGGRPRRIRMRGSWRASPGFCRASDREISANAGLQQSWASQREASCGMLGVWTLGDPTRRCLRPHRRSRLSDDAVVVLLFVYMVASRILAPDIRAQAFANVRDAASSS